MTLLSLKYSLWCCVIVNYLCVSSSPQRCCSVSWPPVRPCSSNRTRLCTSRLALARYPAALRAPGRQTRSPPSGPGTTTASPTKACPSLQPATCWSHAAFSCCWGSELLGRRRVCRHRRPLRAAWPGLCCVVQLQNICMRGCEKIWKWKISLTTQISTLLWGVRIKDGVTVVFWEKIQWERGNYISHVSP